MGLTHLEIEIGNPSNPEVTEKLEFLIDSGAFHSVVPIPVLQRLGIMPLTEQTFRLPNGGKISRKKGAALFRYRDRIGGADVIFGEDGDATVLGSLTLGSLGYVLDPIKRELRDVPLLM